MGSRYFQIFLSAFICCVLAYEDTREAKILDLQQEHHVGDGHYFFRFESSDGITREEEGTLLDANTPDSPVVVKGSYSYTDETGKVYTVRYTADENGFHPEGDHIKVPSFVYNPNPIQPNVLSSINPSTINPTLINPIPINPNRVVLASSPRPPIPIQFIQSTPRPPTPVHYIQSTPRSQFIPATIRPHFIPSTARPQFLPSEPSRFQLNGFSTTERPENGPEVSTAPTRIQLPLDSKRESSKAVPFSELDSKLQDSIVNLLTNGDGRGFNIAAVNSA